MTTFAELEAKLLRPTAAYLDGAGQAIGAAEGLKIALTNSLGVLERLCGFEVYDQLDDDLPGFGSYMAELEYYISEIGRRKINIDAKAISAIRRNLAP